MGRVLRTALLGGQLQQSRLSGPGNQLSPGTGPRALSQLSKAIYDGAG